MRILITGSRNFTEYEYIKEIISGFCIAGENVAWCHSGAKGAEMMADSIIKAIRDCNHSGWTVQKFDAGWGKYGKATDSIRNQQMLDEFKPTLVLAFPSKGSKGTWDMIQRAKDTGVEVMVR